MTVAPPRADANAPDTPRRAGRLRLLALKGWRALTSMGTALVLLFLLALGAVPGALLPQRSLNESKVRQYIADHPTLAPWLDRLQLFDVFSSFWFTAIYVLLFISLVGCLTPRTVEHLRSLRATPVPAPRNLGRLPKHAEAIVAGTPGQVAARISAHLRGWRKVTREADGVIEISAEKGYLREFGNIVFHFSLLGLLVAIAVGKLFGYEGNVIVIANGGPGFCSASPAAYDSFRAGNNVDGTSLYPMCVRVNDFQASYLPSGQATSFSADIDYQAGADLTADIWRPYRLEVNHPLRVGGDRVYLQGHGYAPTFTVTFPGGQQRTQTVQFQPDNTQTLLSSGTLRFDPPAGLYPGDERRKHQIAITGLFAPTAQMDGKLLSSSFPAMNDPAVAIDIYRGDAGLDTGRPQSLFQLDTRLVEQKRLNKVKRINLTLGQEVRLDDGTVVRFDGATPFVNLQVSHDPGQVWVLVSALAMMAGLMVSLIVRRRRVWARITPSGGQERSDPGMGTGGQERSDPGMGTGGQERSDPGMGTGGQERSDSRASAGGGTVVVELGGLARTDNSGWGGEFDSLSRVLTEDS
jgi:cytochrome c biogenesis protein